MVREGDSRGEGQDGEEVELSELSEAPMADERVASTRTTRIGEGIEVIKNQKAW